MKGNVLLRSALVLAAIGPASHLLRALNWPQFTECISASGGGYGSVCQLDPPSPDPYWSIYSTLTIGRSNITVKGTATYGRSTTTLKRMTTGQTVYYMFRVSANVTGVTITDFTLDGNRRDLGLVNVPDTTKQAYLDINLGEPGVSNVTVSLDFKQSPGYSMTAARNYTYVQYCNSWDGGLSTVWSSNQDRNANFSNNYVYDWGGGGVAFQGNGGGIYNNTFFNNHREFPHGAPGGQVYVGAGSQNVTVRGNWIDGNYVCSTIPCDPGSGSLYSGGIEAYGSGHVIAGNEVFHHMCEGISCGGCQNVSIQGDAGYPSYKVEQNACGGITLANFAGFPLTSNITITGITSVNNGYSGVYIILNGYGSMSGINIQNSCLVPNASGDVQINGDPGLVGITIGCTNCNCP